MKYPPSHVETVPNGAIVLLPEAVKRLGRDRRTVIKQIESGELRGGAMPRPERLRWYVYEDALVRAEGVEAPPSPAALFDSAELADARAEIVALRETNRLLIAAQQDLLEADSTAAEKYRSVARRYLDALSQFMTSGHLGELTREL
ncbi:hypothetical protein [Mycolicibacterium mageritense]|uniref:hypothetical protein n=1 Tax=Mycolicibacterium mageritense TaxID=53462 RepID=UPI0011D75D03|nr:hypothetical protein [Mycolicibacterium mageritense]TXI62006.1 MAG: hypothetical protein E6Q55_14270 [Mycolicibacterium mageritense]